MVSGVFIERDLLLSLLEASRRKYPLEFFSLLGGRIEDDVVFVEEVIYIPWKEGYSHAIFDLWSIPKGVIGSFHSHPVGSEPSPEDLSTFPLVGYVHFIAAYPFRVRDVRVYDATGRKIRLIVRGQRASF